MISLEKALIRCIFHFNTYLEIMTIHGREAVETQTPAWWSDPCHLISRIIWRVGNQNTCLYCFNSSYYSDKYWLKVIDLTIGLTDL